MRGEHALQEGEHRLRCGDTVVHEPSGEEWLVAYADYDTGYLAAAGWPESRVQIKDCLLVNICTDAEHREEVALWVGNPSSEMRGDHRYRAVLRLYEPSAEAVG